MATANVQSVQGSSASSSAPTRAFGSNVTTGNLICGQFQWDSGTVTLSSIADSLGNTYALVDNPVTNLGHRCAMFRAKNITGGACTITFTLSGAATSAQVMHEASGCDTTSPDDGHALYGGAARTGTDAETSGAITTTSAGNYTFGCCSEWSTGANVTEGTGFTQAGDGGNAPGGEQMGEYLIAGAAGSIAATFTLSGGGQTFTGLMSFKAAGGAAADTQEWRGSYPAPRRPPVNVSY